MRDRKLNKTDLDAIGKMLVVSDARRVVDIDAIVKDPHLFASVRARIASVETPEPVAPLFALTGFRVAAFGGAAVVLLLVVGAFSLLNTGRGVVAVDTIQIPTEVTELARPVFPPLQGVSLSKLPAGRAKKIEVRSEKSAPVRANARNARPIEQEPNAEFLAVAYTGDPHETAAGGRIIRVDMKRSSLYALGIDLPLENGNETVKADLLVGADGVTRGVRIVQ